MNRSLRIIIVDDNEIDLMIGKRLISRVQPSIVVETFNCGKQAVEWAINNSINCIEEKWIFIIDIYMPQSNGFDVISDISLAIDEKMNSTQYYLLSATIDQYDMAKIKSNPLIKQFIGKPITTSLINELIANNQ
jgi:response regulator RpfG family c-di-GMP phosphodiesterase